MADTWTEYVDLVSTASLDLYPGNVGSSFVNKLVVPQQLPDNTFVALEEIGYVNSFYNVRKTQNSITIYDMLYEVAANTPKLNPNPYPIYGAYFACPLKEGFYGSMQELCNMINEAIRKSGVPQVKDRTIFSYDPVTMKFSYDVKGLWLALWLRGDLLSMLGLEQSQASDSQYVVIGKSKDAPTYEYPKSLIPTIILSRPDNKDTVTRHFRNPHILWRADTKKDKDEFEFVAQLVLVNSMIVYIDCIDSQVTGDSFTDALRIVPIKADVKPGSSVVTHFNKPYFLRCNKRYIPTVAIEIRDLASVPIDFKQGIVRLKLRFSAQPPP